MQKFIFASLFVFISIFCFAQIDIIDARNTSNGQTVTITGIITNASDVGLTRYIQDATAGIALYDKNGATLGNVTQGDRITITGKLTEYKGLLELNTLTNLQVLGTNYDLPNPKEILLKELGEKYESERVRINCSQFESNGYFESGVMTVVQFGNNFGNVYIPNTAPIVGSEIPNGSSSITGINSVYENSQIIVYDVDDIVEEDCYYFVERPHITAIDKNSVSISFSTNVTGEVDVYFSENEKPLILEANLNGKDFTYTFDNLEIASIYKAQVNLKKTGGDISSDIIYMATESNSSGQIEVYFNNEVNTSFSNGAYANGDSYTELIMAVTNAIQSATSTIDIAMYNNSQANIVNELIDAYNKGVVVRYITDNETYNSALQSSLPFHVLKDKGSGLMHNKFIVIDRGISNNAKVITGSTNFTDNQLLSDPNNLIIIHDQSVAKGYTNEFNEMWGGNTEIPNSIISKFGEEKENNTPNLYIIGNNTFIESYFSPSDRTTSSINNQIQAASQSIDVGQLTFTHNSLGNTMVDRAKSGVECRVIIENKNDTGSEFDYLKNNSVQVASHPDNPQFHHKYAIIDEGSNEGVVITGSHNWTVRAETLNDENTLIIHNDDIANIYKQEFEARWNQVVPLSNVVNPDFYILPNPVVNNILIIDKELANAPYLIYDQLGRLVSSGQVLNNTIQTNDLFEGLYILQINGNENVYLTKFVKQ